MRKGVMLLVLTCVMVSLLLHVPKVLGLNGPVTDILTFKVTTGPDAKLEAMTTSPPMADVWPSLSIPLDLLSSPLEEKNGGFERTVDIRALDLAGFTITQDLGFQVGSIVYNIRDTATIQSYYRPEITYWPLHDVEFRHALIHCYDQITITTSLYGFLVMPVRSLVPPAQSKYYNPSVQEHPYNPGDPFTSPSTEHSTSGILKAAGYTFYDAGMPNVVDPSDYWRCPDGSPLPKVEILTPTLASEPTAFTHVSSFVEDLGSVGLAATETNGNAGLTQTTIGFGECMANAYTANFDACIVCYGFDRIPDQMYSLLHSSQDSLIHPGRRNAPGINDTTIDTLLDIVKYSLDTNKIETAAKEVQAMFYNPTSPGADYFALGYMFLYSRWHFNAYNPNIEGIVKTPGFGSDNKFTFLRARWTDSPRMKGTNTQMIWMLDEAPATFNPLETTTKYEWEILAQVHDGLTIVSPYNHRDVPWLASDWTITSTATGMEIDFILRSDVYWQDGHQFTAYDAEFCLEFIRDHQVPRYADSWPTLNDVVVTNATHMKVVSNKAGIALFYNYAGLATILPQHIWDRPWSSDQEVLDYNPTEPYNVAPGYTPGPHPTPTNLFGTGPWIFQFYDDVNLECDLYANRGYYMTQTDVLNVLADLFWEIGDINKDGIINVIDLTLFLRYYYPWPMPYDPIYDFNKDGFIDLRDLRTLCFHLLWQREYP